MAKTKDTNQDAATQATPTNLRLTPEVLVRADRMIGYLEMVHGRRCSRSDVLREALMQGLRSLERDQQSHNQLLAAGFVPVATQAEVGDELWHPPGTGPRDGKG